MHLLEIWFNIKQKAVAFLEESPIRSGMVTLPNNLFTVALLVLLGGDLKPETAYLRIQALQSAIHLLPLRTHLCGLGYSFLHRIKI